MLCYTIPLHNGFSLIGQRYKNHQPRISSFSRNTRCLGHNGLSLNIGVAQLALNKFSLFTLNEEILLKKTLIKEEGVVMFNIV